MHSNLTGIARGRIGLALASLLVVAGCTGVPLGPVTTRPAPSAVAPAPSPAAVPQTALTGASASGAEQACIAAGRDRGLDVAGVVGSRAVTGATGESGRDVMLRVRRSGSEIEVRCNYAADTGMARIMLI